MSTAALYTNPAVHAAQPMRQAGADLLSLALLDARSRTLGWLGAFEGLGGDPRSADVDPPLWCIGHAGWFQEYWVARHVQRGRGEAADAGAPRLASIEPMADAWFDPQASSRAERWAMALPDARALRSYLGATLEATLDLLAKVADGPGEAHSAARDAALHVFRLVLDHEDRLAETLAALVETVELPAERFRSLEQQGLLRETPGRGRREPLVVGAQSMQLGSPPGGWVPAAERWAHRVAVPEFEIDAQPVCWSQFFEFVADGGYDDRQWWTAAGSDWLQGSQRRAPRGVEQLSGGVLAWRNGRLSRLPGAQPALHVNAHEAEAWCGWAGRRLPAEEEWELAATSAAARGFVWGDQLEWVAGSARAYPGATPAIWCVDRTLPGWRVQRGASPHAPSRLRHPRARRYVPATGAELFCGFRSCAV